jgi:hypothetical protein
MVVSFDYSSLALLELLRRQQERGAAGEDPGGRIDAVLIVNGGLFADAHSHPWDTTPMLRTPLGGVAMWFAQHAPGGFEAILRRAKLFSPSYEVSADELAELRDAILRRDGAAFLHRAAGFVDAPSQRHALGSRGDRPRLGDTVAFHIAGSEEDPFEPRQIVAARERLAPFGVEIRTLPGGHLTSSEHPRLLADVIRELADAHGVGSPPATPPPAKP